MNNGNKRYTIILRLTYHIISYSDTYVLTAQPHHIDFESLVYLYSSRHRRHQIKIVLINFGVFETNKNPLQGIRCKEFSFKTQIYICKLLYPKQKESEVVNLIG